VIEPSKPLSDTDRLYLLAFAAAAKWRTPKAREHIRRQWTPILQEMDYVTENMKTWTADQKERAVNMPRLGTDNAEPSMGREDVRTLVDAPLQTTLGTHIKAMVPVLMGMKASILCTSASPGFITSDHPCALFDPEAHKRPPAYRYVALDSPTVELSLPLSPRHLLVVSHDHEAGEYMSIPDALVDHANSITRLYANETIVVCRNELREAWLSQQSPSR
jgi:hypothetical protein